MTAGAAILLALVLVAVVAFVSMDRGIGGASSRCADLREEFRGTTFDLDGPEGGARYQRALDLLDDARAEALSRNAIGEARLCEEATQGIGVRETFDNVEDELSNP